MTLWLSYAHLKIFFSWEERYTQKIMESMPGNYYTDLDHIPENSFRAIHLPDRWGLDMNTVRMEVEKEDIPVLAGWRNMGMDKSGKRRLCRMLFVSEEVLTVREEKFPQLRQSAVAWLALREKLKEHQQQCLEAAAFYNRLPPSLSPEMNLPRASDCPLVRQARQKVQKRVEETSTNKAKSKPDALRWRASMDAACRAVAHVLQSGQEWYKTSKTHPEADFAQLVNRLYTGPGKSGPLSDALTIAWKAIDDAKAGAGNPNNKKKSNPPEPLTH